jgi:hypothetical protein
MPRTDFTQEIDGAFAGRNAGQRHFSEVARSGNGNMRRDLVADVEDYQELTGVGETTEPGALRQGRPDFRWPKAGEAPPMGAKAGFTWLRRRAPSQKPGILRVTWVQVSKNKLVGLKRSGGLSGLGEFPTGIAASLGLGLAGGVAVWYFLLRKKS